MVPELYPATIMKTADGVVPVFVRRDVVSKLISNRQNLRLHFGRIAEPFCHGGVKITQMAAENA